MITQSRENRNARKHRGHLFHGLLQDFDVFFPRLVPDVVRRQVSRPKNVVYILETYFKLMLLNNVLHNTYRMRVLDMLQHVVDGDFRRIALPIIPPSIIKVYE